MDKKELSELYSTRTLREIGLLTGHSHEKVRTDMIGFDLPRRKRGRRSKSIWLTEYDNYLRFGGSGRTSDYLMFSGNTMATEKPLGPRQTLRRFFSRLWDWLYGGDAS